MISNARPASLLAALRLTALAVGCAVAAQAQVAVTAVNYGSLVNGPNRTADNLTYRNEYFPVSTVSTANETYNFAGSVASAVYLRRNTGSGNPNNTTAFYSYASYTSSSSATVVGLGDSSPTAGEVMLSNDLGQGLRNPFANTGGTTSLNSNIERIDFYFADGYTVQADDALVFFDLENQGNFGDGFRIAAYNAVGTVNGVSNAPTTYANTGLLVAPDSFGPAVDFPGGTNPRYLRSTTTNGDNLAANQSLGTIDTANGTPGANDLYLVGILIPLSDLGLIVGQKIYGYSLFAGDVAFADTNQMANWNNSVYYPTNTPADTWGNMDFMGFGAQLARPVPEPSTYGAISLGLGLAALGLRRWRARTANAA